MGKVKQYRRGLAGFIASDKGQRFFNFAYSIGAAIVIWGALFKILHLPGGNTLLSLGMGTEVLMFILTAFDRPPREYQWENVFPALDKKDADAENDTAVDPDELLEQATQGANQSQVHGTGGGTVIIGSGVVGGGTVTVQGSQAYAEPVHTGPVVHASANPIEANEQYTDQVTLLAAEMQHLRESTEALNQVSETLLASYRAITENSENISASSTGYVEQMQSLNRNISGLNTIYEIQLKSISSQLDAIDRVNRGIKDIRDMYEKSASQSARYAQETEKMARYMQQLNSVYEKMITAMTINMYNPMMGAQGQPMSQQPSQPATPADNEPPVFPAQD